MFWNPIAREWQPHPECRCGQPTWRACYCSGLRPLDAAGKIDVRYDELLGIGNAAITQIMTGGAGPLGPKP